MAYYEGDPTEIYFRWEKEYTGAVKLGRQKQLRAHVIASVKDVREQVERLGMHVACKAGCSACCHLKADISETDARVAVKALKRLPAPVRNGIVAKLKVQREQEALHEDPFDYDHPCSFLVNDRCAIYKDRPVTCRAMFSGKPELCGTREVIPIASDDSFWHSSFSTQAMAAVYGAADSNRKRSHSLAHLVLWVLGHRE